MAHQVGLQLRLLAGNSTTEPVVTLVIILVVLTIGGLVFGYFIHRCNREEQEAAQAGNPNNVPEENGREQTIDVLNLESNPYHNMQSNNNSLIFAIQQQPLQEPKQDLNPKEDLEIKEIEDEDQQAGQDNSAFKMVRKSKIKKLRNQLKGVYNENQQKLSDQENVITEETFMGEPTIEQLKPDGLTPHTQQF